MASSIRRLRPSARSVQYSTESRKLIRASNCPSTRTLITASRAATSHNATACRWMERSVFAA